jgi:putative CocE/NonD family hydrolase
MRDGTELACNIRFPAKGGPFPTILVRTPYGKNHPESDLVPFLNDGYAFVVQDVRGKFDSSGEFHPMREDNDGVDTINWIASQPWSNGKVGMTGGSYCAFTQFYPAIQQPKPLCACAMSVMGHNLFKNCVYRNGVLELSLLAWLIINSGRVVNVNAVADWNRLFKTLPVSDMAEKAGYKIPALDEWLSHSRKSESYWQKLNYEGSYDKINIPVYLIGGWYDFYASAIPEIYGNLKKAGKKNNLKLLMGPWGHKPPSESTLGELSFGEQSIVNHHLEKKRWHDRFLKGIDNGIDKEAPVKIFTMGINQWREEDHWPLKKAVEKSFYLACKSSSNSMFGNGALLFETDSKKESSSYIYDPANPMPTIGGNALLPNIPQGPFDQRPIERRDDMLVFTSEELKKPLDVTGPVKAELFISSSAPDTDFVARLCDVYPDGRSMPLCEGILRTRFRDSLKTPKMMKKAEVCKVTVEMEVTSNVFLPGHRIRLDLTSSSFPRYARNLNSGGDNIYDKEFAVAEQTVFHSKSRPSRLILPVVEV